MNVKTEIEQFSAPGDKSALLRLFDKYHWESQWRFVATCSHRRVGPLSHQTVRVWSPTPEGRTLAMAPALLDALKDVLTICLSRGGSLGLDDQGPVFDQARAVIAAAEGRGCLVP